MLLIRGFELFFYLLKFYEVFNFSETCFMGIVMNGLSLTHFRHCLGFIPCIVRGLSRHSPSVLSSNEAIDRPQ